MKPDPVRAPASREPERDNASLQPARTSVRAPMRPRAAVFQRLAGSEPGRPFRGRRGRALEPLRGSTDRPSFLNDQSRETESSERGQRGVSVSHEDLLAEMVCGNPHPPGGLPFSAQPFTTCRGTTAQGRGIVDPVTDHPCRNLLHRRSDFTGLVFRSQFGMNGVYTGD